LEHPLPSPDALVRPWRTATLIASGVAALELVLLVGAGGLMLAKPLSREVRASAQVHAFKPVAKPKPARPPKAGAPKLARNQVTVMVLNGNGRTGAASDEAQKVRRRGYMIGTTGNAPRSDYATTVVMYRPGYRPEGLRLAHDLHVKVVGPLDGLSKRDLLGAHAAVIVGAA
jgi:LytR cell envelope-related transcriptional attenuator